jgi:integrase
MSDVHPSTPAKPGKPYPDFPLFPHATRRWAKKIRGKLHYFGPWSDPDGALARYLAEKDALHAGRTPRADPEALTVKDVVNAFLTHKKAKVETGELSPRTWDGYKEITDLMVKHFGKARLVADLAPADFEALRNKVAKRWGLYGLSRLVQGVRSVFKHADDAGLIDRPMRFGPGFARPTKKTFRLHRARQGPKLFTADEIRRMIAGAGVPLKAMILLGINAGFGNADCGNLPLTAVDLGAGVIDFPRPKTGIPRRCSLWPETVAALREVLDTRPEPKRPEHADQVFLTNRGQPWARDNDPGIVSKEMSKLLRSLGINGHRNFYTLRHVFRTVADESKDQPAVDFIMGHEVPHMSSIYRETISDARLRAVADQVRRWLFAEQGSERQDGSGADQGARQAPAAG